MRRRLFFCACLMILLAVSGCGGMRRTDETITLTDVNPTYIPSPPLDKSVALYFAASGEMNSDNLAVADVARNTILRELWSRGYEAVDAGKLHTLCSSWSTWTGYEASHLCEERFHQMERNEVLSFLKGNRISTALMVQIDFREVNWLHFDKSGNYKGKVFVSYRGQDGKTYSRDPYLAIVYVARLLDESGLTLNQRSGAMYSYEHLDSKTKQLLYKSKSNQEWGSDIGSSLFLLSNKFFFPSKFERPAPSIQEISKILLTEGAWTIEWKYLTTFPFMKDEFSGRSGQLAVRFLQRDGDTIAMLARDPALGSDAAESKVTITRAGISFFVPKLGRLRMRTVINSGQASFEGGVPLPVSILIKVKGHLDYSYPDPMYEHVSAVLRPPALVQ